MNELNSQTNYSYIQIDDEPWTDMDLFASAFGVEDPAQIVSGKNQKKITFLNGSRKKTAVFISVDGMLELMETSTRRKMSKRTQNRPETVLETRAEEPEQAEKSELTALQEASIAAALQAVENPNPVVSARENKPFQLDERITRYLETPLPENWESMCFLDRRIYLQSPSEKGTRRTSVTVDEIIVEAFQDFKGLKDRKLIDTVLEDLANRPEWKFQPLVNSFRPWLNRQGYIRKENV